MDRLDDSPMESILALAEQKYSLQRVQALVLERNIGRKDLPRCCHDLVEFGNL